MHELTCMLLEQFSSESHWRFPATGATRRDTRRVAANHLALGVMNLVDPQAPSILVQSYIYSHINMETARKFHELLSWIQLAFESCGGDGRAPDDFMWPDIFDFVKNKALDMTALPPDQLDNYATLSTNIAASDCCLPSPASSITSAPQPPPPHHPPGPPPRRSSRKRKRRNAHDHLADDGMKKRRLKAKCKKAKAK